MKVKINDKILLPQYAKSLSAIAAILSLILTVFDIEQKCKIVIAVCFLAVFITVCLALWIYANRLQAKVLKINGTKVTIKYSDLFSEAGNKIIAFNEYFDTTVDDKIISETSLNGQYINGHVQDIDELNNKISSDLRLKNAIVEANVNRAYGGKTTKYRLGSICPVDDFFLLAFTHFDDDNRAFISLEDYISCLMHMWSELDVVYAGKPIVFPLLGNGITRFNNAEVKPQDLLKYIIMTFKISKVRFGNTSSLTIVLTNNIRNEINLYSIQED